MNNETWMAKAPEDKPSTARMYDYLLGGYHNFEIDRSFAEHMLRIVPYLRETAQITRGFLRRSVQFATAQGIEQFLDIGSGLPTMGNVHDIAQAVNPSARIAYVDIDPIAVAHGRALLADNPAATAIRYDLRHSGQILEDPEVLSLLDFSRPLAVVLVAVLHFVVEDDQAYAAVTRLRQALAPGSYLIILHAVPDAQPGGSSDEVGRAYRPVSSSRSRYPEEILPFFAGLDLLEPGLVLTPLWRPEGPDDLGLATPDMGLTMAAVGRKP
jgi:SAM-dependent methyltransferase